MTNPPSDSLREQIAQILVKNNLRTDQVAILELARLVENRPLPCNTSEAARLLANKLLERVKNQTTPDEPWSFAVVLDDMQEAITAHDAEIRREAANETWAEAAKIANSWGNASSNETERQHFYFVRDTFHSLTTKPQEPRTFMDQADEALETITKPSKDG